MLVSLSAFYVFFKACLFWLCWAFVAVSGLSLSCSTQLLLAVASLVWEHRLYRVCRLQELRLLGSRAQAQ